MSLKIFLLSSFPSCDLHLNAQNGLNVMIGARTNLIIYKLQMENIYA